MYWMIWTTLFWAWSFGNYASVEDCERAAEKAPFYVSAKCVPLPEKSGDHTH